MEQSLSESLQSLSEIPFKIIYYYVTDTSTYFFLTIPTSKYFFLNSRCLTLFNTIRLAAAVHGFQGYIEQLVFTKCLLAWNLIMVLMIYQEISAFSQIFLKYALDISFFLLSGYSFKDTEDSRSNLEWQREEKKDFTYSSLPLRLLRNMEGLTFSCVNFVSCLQRLQFTEFYLMMKVNCIKYCPCITNVMNKSE